MKSERDLDRLVEEIASRVQARISERRKLLVLDAPCHATKEECGGDGLCARRRPWSMDAMRQLGAVRFSASPGIGQLRSDLAAMIDHTLLKPEATREDVRKLCEEAKQYGFYSVCVNPAHVATAARLLAGSAVKVCAVVGFPLGANAPAAKAFEAREAVRAGAREVDMVVNIGALKEGDYPRVLEDIHGVVEAARSYPVKVILETGGLTDEQKVVGCVLAKCAGAAFVKTSTGFGPGGATTGDVALMRRVVGPEMGVKASGGVRTTEDADKMVQAGADRIGASASVAIVTGQKAEAKKKGY
jgi:deoxyribose-phosphate aldolase